jgi:hypothetical protein
MSKRFRQYLLVILLLAAFSQSLVVNAQTNDRGEGASQSYPCAHGNGNLDCLPTVENRDAPAALPPVERVERMRSLVRNVGGIMVLWFVLGTLLTWRKERQNAGETVDRSTHENVDAASMQPRLPDTLPRAAEQE